MKIENDGKTLTLTIDISKEGHISSTGKTLVLFTTAGWQEIKGGLLLSVCVAQPLQGFIPCSAPDCRRQAYKDSLCWSHHLQAYSRKAKPTRLP